MHFLNDWHDYLRVVVIFVCVYSAYVLLRNFRTSSDTWNEKTRDYWYALFMWVIAGIAVSVQGIVLDRPLTPGQIFVSAAALVTGRGLNRKGSWGGGS